MPAVRHRARDVIIRVPKVEPYSNDYGKTASAEDTITTNSTTVTTTTEEQPQQQQPTQIQPQPQPQQEQDQVPQIDSSKPHEPKNAPTIGLITVERDEPEAVTLSKASTSSAAWNSLLVWARRQRGPQWDSATGIWQVDKYSEEYYSFCADPTQSVAAEGGADGKEAEATEAGTIPAQGTAAGSKDDDDDRGPAARNVNSPWRGKEDSPPIGHGRSARLLRR